VAANELGGRSPAGAVGRLLFLAALGWSLFQLYVASPLPYALGKSFVLGDTQSRLIHYAFAVFLCFCSFPAFNRSRRDRIPLADWVWAVVAACTALYMFVFYDELARRAAAPLPRDMLVAAVGVICLLEAVRRAIGMALLVVALVFIAYIFLGPYMPEVIAHPATSIARAADHMWLSREGIFGFTLGISSSVVFLFVLFGSMLERAGAGHWFIKTSFALLGHLRGGPAKAAVISSALTGVISGSALANVVTTGTFTIPLMKRVGFPAEKAAGIESTSSINGQLMPPVMGAAAFLMTEFVGISYQEVVVHALLPAVISYIGLFYIVHLEATKLQLTSLQRAVRHTWVQRIAGFLASFLGLVLLSGALYYGLGWMKSLFGSASIYVASAIFAATYVLLVRVSARMPDLDLDDPDAPTTVLPETQPTLLAGLHYLPPIVVLIWCLMIERFSPGYAIYWAILALAFVMLTQRPLMVLFRRQSGYQAAFRRGLDELIAGLAAGARNMVGVAIALAAAGIIVGTVSLTGLGLVMVNVIELLSGDSLIGLLFFTAVISIILGMGLPTTANYVVVASIMAPVVVTLAGQHGVVIPLIAVHMFVFYCGLMSGNTPPVAVDAYAAAALARSDPMRTCVQAFYYGIRTILLPFIFVFNTELLLIGITGPVHFVVVVSIATIAMLLFVAATQHYFLVRNRPWETLALLLFAFSLLLPSWWIDTLVPPYRQAEPVRLEALAEQAPTGALLRVRVRGKDFSGLLTESVVALPLGPRGEDGAQRLIRHGGLAVRLEDGRVLVDNLRFDGPAQRAQMDYDWEILAVDVPQAQPAKYWVYPPVLLLTALLMLWQRRRAAAGPSEAPARV